MGFLINSSRFSTGAAAVSRVHFWPLNDNNGGPYADTGTIGGAPMLPIETVADDVVFGGISIVNTAGGAVASSDTSDRFDDIFSGDDKKFSLKVEIEFDEFITDGTMVAKYASIVEDGHEFQLITRSGGTMVDFLWYGVLNGATHRWTRKSGLSLQTGTKYTFAVSYDGTIDTNDGLDRVVIYIDGVAQTGLVMNSSVGSLHSIPFGPAQLSIGEVVTSTGGARGIHLSGNFKNLAVYDGIIDAAEAA